MFINPCSRAAQVRRTKLWCIPGQLCWGSSVQLHRRGCRSHGTKSSQGRPPQERLSICQLPHTRLLGAFCMHTEHTICSMMHTVSHPMFLPNHAILHIAGKAFRSQQIAVLRPACDDALCQGAALMPSMQKSFMIRNQVYNTFVLP